MSRQSAQMAMINSRIQERDRQFLKHVENHKDLWPCPHHKKEEGEHYAMMLRHDASKYACAKKECLKGHRCVIQHPPKPQRVPKSKRPCCGAKTRAGGKCKAKVVHGKTKCRMHGGLSTGPRTDQGKAAIIASNKRRAKAKL